MNKLYKFSDDLHKAIDDVEPLFNIVMKLEGQDREDVIRLIDSLIQVNESANVFLEDIINAMKENVI